MVAKAKMLSNEEIQRLIGEAVETIVGYAQRHGADALQIEPIGSTQATVLTEMSALRENAYVAEVVRGLRRNFDLEVPHAQAYLTAGRLEERGFVTKATAPPRDRSSRPLAVYTLTPQGVATIVAMARYYETLDGMEAHEQHPRRASAIPSRRPSGGPARGSR